MELGVATDVCRRHKKYININVQSLANPASAVGAASRLAQVAYRARARMPMLMLQGAMGRYPRRRHAALAARTPSSSLRIRFRRSDGSPSVANSRRRPLVRVAGVGVAGAEAVGVEGAEAAAVVAETEVVVVVAAVAPVEVVAVVAAVVDDKR